MRSSHPQRHRQSYPILSKYHPMRFRQSRQQTADLQLFDFQIDCVARSQVLDGFGCFFLVTSPRCNSVYISVLYFLGMICIKHELNHTQLDHQLAECIINRMGCLLKLFIGIRLLVQWNNFCGAHKCIFFCSGTGQGTSLYKATQFNTRGQMFKGVL